ncbi:MAG: methyltransferase domain-containing protein [Chloroherpetonaceae bacterium]|nr:methyltransferase domain-containing protein [bacterium]
MKFNKRIPKELFKDEHYLGKPADFNDIIIQRRVRLVKQIKDFTGKTLVDIGCGNGASILMLADQMSECTGLDIEASHKSVFEKYREQLSITNCEFQVFNIEKEKLNKQFDRLISFEVIEHLEDEKNVKYFYEALKPGGIAAITVPNKWWIFETHGAKLPLLPWNRVPFFSWLPRPIHEKYANARIYTKKRIKKLLTSIGFEVEQIKYITAPLDVLPDGFVKKSLQKFIFKNDTTSIPFLSTSIFIVARKK